MQKLKRDNGDTFNSILPNFFCIIVVLVLVILFTSWIANVDNRENLNQICRKYILQMETTGYLTTDMEVELVNDLKNAGMNTVTVESTTTKSQVQYGEDVYLQISGTMNVFDNNVQGPGSSKMMQIIRGTDQWTVHIYKTSISKAQKKEEVIDNSLYVYVTQGANGRVVFSGAQAPKKIKLDKGNSISLQVTANDGYYIEDGNFIYGQTANAYSIDIPKIIVSETATSISYDSSSNTYTLPKLYETGTTIAITATGDGLTSVTTSGEKVIGFTFQISNIQTNKLFSVSFTPRNDIKYTVNHYTRNLDGVTLLLMESKTYIGTMHQNVSPDVYTYEGFTSPVKQTIKLSIGENKIDYIYDRNRYNFNIEFPTDELIRTNISTDGSTASGSYFYGETINLKLSVNADATAAFKVNGFVSNWNNKTFNNTDSFIMPAQDVTVSPNIITNKYKIKYDANGGTGTIQDQEVGYFDTIKLADDTSGITRQYYKLLGWSTNSKATEPEYSLGEEVSKLTTNQNITLYAIWQDLGKTSYKVTYYVENLDGTFTQKETKTISDNVFSSTLVEVSDLKDDKYEEEGKITYGYSQINGFNTTIFYPEADGSTHVHVYYTIKQYTLTVIPSNHSQVNAMSEYSLSLKAGEAVDLNATFDLGYEMDDWTINSALNITATKNKNKLTFNMPACDVRVTLKHKCTTYMINIDKNGGVWTDESYKDYIEFNIETATFIIPNPVRDHYTFIGWTTDTIAEPQMVMEITKGTTGNINLYANWIAEMLNVVIKCATTDQGNVYVDDKLVEFKDGVATIEVPYNTKTSIAFVPNSKVSITKLNRIINSNSTDLLAGTPKMGQIKDELLVEYQTIYEVKFEPLTYTITYHSNNNKNATVEQTLTFNKKDHIYTIDEVNNLSSNKFVRNGWDFGGWALKEVDSAIGSQFKVYDGGEEILNLAEENFENIDLYATWDDKTPPTYTVSITNNVDEKQTITVNAVDNESGVGGYYYSNHKLTEEEIKNISFNATADTYEMKDSGSIYIYVSDNAGNIYCNNVEYIFYKTTLDLSTTASYTPYIEQIITLKGNSFTFPEVEKTYYKYKGWNTNKDAATGIKTLTPTGNTTYYPILVKTDANLLPGIYVNTALKQLINTAANYETVDTTITSIEFTTQKPGSGTTSVLISDVSEQSTEVIAYRSGSTIKLYTVAENVNYNQDCNYMFANLRNVSTNDLLNSDKIKTKEMRLCEGMFEYYGYNSITSLDVSKLNTSLVSTMYRMFYNTGYNNMKTLTLGNNFDTSQVINMRSMFAGCGYNSLTSINLGSKFDTSNVLDMNSMFAHCGYKSLTSINFGSKFNSNSVTETRFMFSYFGYESLKTFTLPSTFTCESVSYDTSMFEYMGHNSMTSADISSYNGEFASRNLFEDVNFWRHNYFIGNCGKPNSCNIKVKNTFVKQNITSVPMFYQNVDATKITY